MSSNKLLPNSFTLKQMIFGHIAICAFITLTVNTKSKPRTFRSDGSSFCDFLLDTPFPARFKLSGQSITLELSGRGVAVSASVGVVA